MYSLIRNNISRVLQRDLTSIVGSLSRYNRNLSPIYLFIYLFSFSSTSIRTPPLTQTRKDGDDPTVPDSQSPDLTKTTDNKIPWKANVIEMPVAMGPQHIIENYREHREGGFYYDHRLIIPEMPEEYTVKPFATRKTGGNHPDTGKTNNFH
jgi:hypothetical protein